MPLSHWNRTGCLIDGRDLVVVGVRAAGGRLRAGEPVRLEDFRARSLDEMRPHVEHLIPASGVVIICPSSWTGVRPIALDRAQWKRGRANILSSIEGFFPFSPDRAMVGFIERAGQRGEDGGEGEHTPEGAGYLVGCDRTRPDEWKNAILDLLGAEEARCLVSPHMALPALGLQHLRRAGVVERSVTGALVLHTLNYGRVETLDQPLEEPDSIAQLDHVALLPGATLGFEPPVPCSTIAPAELAIAGAACLSVPGAPFDPLAGRASPPSRRLLTPLAIAAAAGLLVLGANWIWNARLDIAIERIERERESLRAEFDRALETKARATRLADLIAKAGAEIDAWRPISPDLIAGVRAIPDGGYLYEIEVDGDSVRVSGEAGSAADVLRSIESSDRFHSAERTAPSRPIQTRLTFDVEALRESAPKEGA